MYILEVKVPTNIKNEFIWWPVKKGNQKQIENSQNELTQCNPSKVFRIKK